MKANLLLLLLALFLGACGNKVVPHSALKEEVELDKVDYKKNGFKAGTVFDNTGLDGCGFMISLEDKSKLDPTDLPAEFKKDQLPVWVKYQYKKGAVGVCMSGRIVTLLEIKSR
jgi:hypothetical protein